MRPPPPPAGGASRNADGAGDEPGDAEVADEAELDDPAEESSTDRDVRNRWM